MDNFAADFTINNNSLQADYELGEGQHLDCLFELYAAGTVWGSIDGTLSNQTDLQNALDAKQDTLTAGTGISIENNVISNTQTSAEWGNIEGTLSNQTDLQNELNGLSDDITANHDEIGRIGQLIGTYGDIVTYDASDFATSAQGALADTALQSGDNITELNNNAGYITGINSTDVTNALGYTPYSASNPDGFITGIDSTDVTTALGYTPYDASNPAGYITSADLPTLEDLTTQAQMNAINSGATTVNIAQIASNTQAISTETLNRQNADNGLQSQIDAIVASSDVFDIVGTYAELQAYDISTVPPNDIIKVLVDSTHNNAATYYRCIETNSVKSWSYIGSEGAYYTKSEADGRFVPLTRTINGKALSNNITLDATDVGALPSSTVIPTVNDGTLTIQVNGTSVGTFTANQSGNTTANIVVPDSATWGNITGDIDDQTDLQNVLSDKQDKLTAGTDLEILNGSPLHNLPSGYTELEYIQSSGTQYLDTGIAYKDGIRAEVDFQYVSYSNTAYTFGFNDYLGYLFFVSSNGVYTINPSQSLNYTASIYNKTHISALFNLNNNIPMITVTIGNETKTYTRNDAGGTVYNLQLFTVSAQTSNISVGRCYGVKIYDNDVLVMELVPALRTSDNKVGMYDTVGNTFKINSGTGNFIGGAPAVEQTIINFTNDTGYITGITSSNVTTALGYTPVNPSSLATVATSGDYDDLTNKPTIPTVGDGTITITQGGVTKGTFTTNQSGNSTIALDAGGGGSVTEVFVATYGTTTFAEIQTAIAANKVIICNYNDDIYYLNITDIESGAVTLGYWFTAVNPNSSTNNVFGLYVDNTSNWDTNVITFLTPYTTTNITGTFTFQGEKKIKFKQSTSNDKLGFTLYNSSSTELGAFEYRPNTISGSAFLNINCPYSADYVGFRYWGTAVNIIAPKVATAGDYYIPVNITDGNTTVTANSTGTVNISSLLPNVSGYLQNTATGTDSLTVLGTASTGDGCINIGVGSQTSYDAAIAIGAEYDLDNGASASDYSIAIGTGANASASYSVVIGSKASATNVSGTGVAIGSNALASGSDSIALGKLAEATADNAYQIGEGTNNTTYSLQVDSYTLLDTSTGLIPDARISSNIARTSQIPTVPTLTYSSATETLTFS